MKIRVKLVFITSFIHHEMSKILIEKGIEGINVEYPEKSVRHRWTRERFRRSISDITFALAFHSRYCIIEQHLLSSSVIRRDRMYRSRIRVLYEKRATWNETPLGTIYYSRNFFNGTNQIHLGQSRIRRFTVRLKFSGTHSWRQNVYIYIQLFILRMDLFGVWKWCVEERWVKMIPKTG